MVKLFLHTDGAARGNPGPAASAFVLANERGDVLHEEGKRIGDNTNNVAEYTAVIMGLAQAHIFGASAVVCHSDSQLIMRQLSGEYKIKQAHLLELHKQAKEFEKGFESVEYVWCPRNSGLIARADQLCNMALDGELR